MPWTQRYTTAEKFMKYRGISFFHTYEDDDFNQGPERYRFVMSPDGRVEDGFEVRDLPGWAESPHPPYLTGEDNTSENRKLWDEWRDNSTEAKHIKAFLKRIVDYFLAVADMPVYTFELRWAEHKSITHRFLNAEDARAWWQTRIETEILDKCEVTDLEVQQIGKA